MLLPSMLPPTRRDLDDDALVVCRRRRWPVCPEWLTTADERVAAWTASRESLLDWRLAKTVLVWTQTEETWLIDRIACPWEARAVVDELRRGLRVHRARVAAAALYVIQKDGVR